MSSRTANMAKQAKTDRLFTLEIIDGKKPKNSTGMVDPRLFGGENQLHIQKDKETNFWYFTYDKGLPPKELRCMFTTFPAALRHAEQYYFYRNLTIKEIDD